MPRYDEMRYLSTHNSYSGGKDKRRSLDKQLEAGVRCIEFDFHDDAYRQVLDYRVGHGGPGEEVDQTPTNPAEDLRLTAWLNVLAKWSAGRAGHAPITIVLDAKDPLTDNPTGGDPADLNATLDRVFKTQIFRRDHHTGKWPQWTDLKNKFLCVLSGSLKNRKCYRWDFGKVPAIGVNTAGSIVMAFAEDSGDLSCWSGAADADEAITWKRRCTYATFANSSNALFEPAVAVSDEGWVVCVHRRFLKEIPNGLWYRLGRLDSEGRIDWFKHDGYALGTFPTLKIDGTDITEIHTQSDTGAFLKMLGTIDTAKKRIKWESPKKTQQKPFLTDQAKWQAFTIKCGTHRTDKWIGCRFDDKPLLPARYGQLAFVEMQSDDEADSLIDPLFFAAPADSSAKIARARRAGLVARGWGFAKGNADNPANPKENFAATDTPFARWYVDYMKPRDGEEVGGIAE
jgi:hypothetical protein